MLKKPKQLPLIKEPRKNTKLWWIVKQSTYGGSLNYRKVARPFDSKKLTHAVLMGAVGKELRFTKSSESIRKVIKETAKKYEVKIKELAINHDHIHILFYTKLRESQKRFLRFIAAELGRKYQKLREKFGIESTKSLWRQRPFTRLVSWGKKSLKIVVDYIKKNHDEAMGFIPYQPRQHRLTTFLKKWSQPMESTA
jgi:REP element-mobilizing transposase RayT